MSKVDYATVFDAIGYRPHPGQRKIHASPVRNRVVSAGRRFGKSRVGGVELYPELLLTHSLLGQLEDLSQRREFWIVGPEYSDSEKEFRVLWDILAKEQVPLDRPGSYNDPVNGSLHVSVFGGKFQVHGKSAKHPETLVGEGLSGVILAEAAKLKQTVWTKYIRPTLADFKGWALMTSTPEGRNWFYDLYGQGKDPAYSDWASWRMPSWTNPYVYPGQTVERDIKLAQAMIERGRPEGLDALRIDPEIMSLVLDLTPESFNQEIGADFTEFVGRVFKEFDEEVHVGDFPYNPRWETYAAVDYGFTNPFVWLLIQVGPFDEVRVIGEHYASGETVRESAESIRRKGLAPDGLIAFYPDPAAPGETRELSSVLKVRARGNTGGALSDRIKLIRRALKPQPVGRPNAKPQLKFDRSCTNLVREFSVYRYPKIAGEAQKSNVPEAPMKKDDHTPEALGRFFKGHYGSHIMAGGTRVRGSTLAGVR